MKKMSQVQEQASGRRFYKSDGREKNEYDGTGLCACRLY